MKYWPQGASFLTGQHLAHLWCQYLQRPVRKGVALVATVVVWACSVPGSHWRYPNMRKLNCDTSYCAVHNIAMCDREVRTVWICLGLSSCAMCWYLTIAACLRVPYNLELHSTNVNSVWQHCLVAFLYSCLGKCFGCSLWGSRDLPWFCRTWQLALPWKNASPM